MSKQLAAKLLINKMNKITNPNDRKKHLINCLDRQGFIKEEVQEIVVEKCFAHAKKEEKLIFN